MATSNTFKVLQPFLKDVYAKKKKKDLVLNIKPIKLPKVK